MSRITTLALAVTAVLALAACTAQEPEITLEEQVPADQRQEETAPEGDAEDTGVFTYEAVDLGFEGPTELPAGQVTVRLDNAGNLPHDITIEELGDRMILDTEGGESQETTISLDEGTYTFYCSVPGHRTAMELTVEVSG